MKTMDDVLEFLSSQNWKTMCPECKNNVESKGEQMKKVSMLEEELKASKAANQKMKKQIKQL